MDAADGKSIRPNHPVENRLKKMSIPRNNTSVLLNKVLEDVLVCPVCRQSLHVDPTAETLWLTCGGCRLRYPVEDGIPILIRERAQPEGTQGR